MKIYCVEYPITDKVMADGMRRWCVDAEPLFEDSTVRFIEWPKAPRDPCRVTWMAPDEARRCGDGLRRHWEGPPHGDWVG